MSKKPTRMEQLGNLLTAMVAVIVGGQSDLLLDPPVYSSHPELQGIDLREFRKGGRYYGVYARVARKIKVSRPLVFYTAKGKGTRRVLLALLSEIRAVDNMPAPPTIAPLSSLEISQFRTGKYRGVITRTACVLGMDVQNVWRVAHGEKSKRVLTALRAEMARVDAELASKKGGSR